MGADDKLANEVLMPIEQDTVIFYGHPLVVVRLVDGRICAVLRWLCEGLRLDPSGQLERIRRKTALANGLVRVRVETAGGPQVMPALTLDVLPGWFYTIDENRVKPDTKTDVILFQCECTAVLAEFCAKKAWVALPSPSDVVPAETPKPTEPPHDASNAAWATYHEQMAEWYRWRDDIEVWRTQAELRLRDHEQQLGELQARVEGDEEVSRMLIEMMQRQPPQPLTPEHQATVKAMIKRLHDLAGFGFGAIYGELNEAFHVGKFSDIPDVRWEEVVAWLTVRIKAAEKHGR